MIPSHLATLEEIVDRLVRVLAPERVYLFGSRARGDAKPDSDSDDADDFVNRHFSHLSFCVFFFAFHMAVLTAQIAASGNRHT